MKRFLIVYYEAKPYNSNSFFRKSETIREEGILDPFDEKKFEHNVRMYNPSFEDVKIFRVDNISEEDYYKYIKS